MSEYYRTLLPVASDHYLDKLKVMGLEEGDDQYADNGRFVDDMDDAMACCLVWTHFCYFIQRPGVYSQWKKKNKKKSSPNFLPTVLL